MTQLRLFSARTHDLPPKWDGRVVEWSEWDSSPIFVCGPRGAAKRSPCEGCGSTRSQATSIGTVYPLASETYEVEQPRVKTTRSGREYVSGTVVAAMRARPTVQLHASRCPGCGLDTVFDVDTGECWTLDDSDYGDDGSEAPS